jgi:flagellar hook-associated protein 3 FlgL
MKDIIMVLGVLKNMPPVEHAPGALNDPLATNLAEDTAPFPPREKQENFFKVINDLTATLNKAIQGMDQVTYKLSQVQAQIAIVKESNIDQINTYTDIVADSENVDITEVSAMILQMQTQLQASFQVTALVSQLTLANFLGR